MKAGIGDGSPQRIAVAISHPFKRNDQVERPMRHLAYAGRNHPRVLFSFWNTDTAFVRVCGKILNHAGSGVRIAQQFVDWLDRSDALVAPVAARMIIRPQDRFRIPIIARVAGLVRIRMFSVKEMRAAHASQGTKRRSQILMIARRENSAPSLAKTSDALTVGHR